MNFKEALFTGLKDQVFVDSTGRSYQLLCYDGDEGNGKGRLLIYGEREDRSVFPLTFESLDDRLATIGEYAQFRLKVPSHSHESRALENMAKGIFLMSNALKAQESFPA